MKFAAQPNAGNGIGKIMKSKIAAGAGAVAIAVASLPGTAFAVDPVRESYLSLYGGLAIPQETDIDYDDGTISATGTLEFDNGFRVGAAAGYNWAGPRFEIEVGYNSFEASKLKDVSINGSALTGSATGAIDFSLLTVFGNVLYEIATDSPFTPYVGVGLGVGFLEASPEGAARTVFGTGGDDTIFAYQGIVGGKMQLSEGTSAFVDYRYLGTSEAKMGDFSGSISTHNINAGFMFSFSPTSSR
ncbi:outer membrane protein [Zavarzinia compransoris]|uniref:Outer membrane protein beta-barrel domain-containing protein n=1 Tax=Zavarzinia compransoris TaxID=1264899 RepID=A0A317E3J9_9PROT|nr:outer membrane beta-barrel protein [Zavarzinia compransoris]PWR21688.1 hypothetical protein DKG75_06730 [Zavarzinia compransoris]TDP45526.1 opacity protein-like surface antigen [Zavarzinia compransoris]